MGIVIGNPLTDRSAGSRHVLFVMATDHEYREKLRARINPLITGVGPVEAAIGTTIRLEQLRAAGELPDLVVSLGSAGSRRCELGGVYQIGSVSWRDIDASPLGFPPGVTPFADHPPVISLPTPLAGVPCATLSTGSDIVAGDRYATIDADLVDMETFAVLRACQRFGVSMIGLRGVSDGPGKLDGVSGWTELLPLLDERLAAVVDRLILSQAPTRRSPPTS
ncbi:5'-methylthioadenosine/S-adenosylhomocysteine nucleosidase [Sphingomonas rubra]|uniref:Adenosylhomocysteine nucleosidase n=1 Tax=Sphingomonas rubra TaxID=634430 RepID=A0A1I5TG43_9SPHN|nr:5'-methylthioadenosine/S-adenosylhomocysteine nucleosidase [Sphingomonas rubra]SFP82009.1 adenosylhomocysteine nucleosidase [Sphingomonas rubra]